MDVSDFLVGIALVLRELVEVLWGIIQELGRIATEFWQGIWGMGEFYH